MTAFPLAMLRNPSPRRSAECWIFGPKYADLDCFYRVASLLGMDEAFRARSEFAVTLVGGAIGVEYDIWGHADLETLVDPVQRVTVQLDGFQFPLRISYLVGYGAIIDIEMLRPSESSILWDAVVRYVNDECWGRPSETDLVVVSSGREVDVDWPRRSFPVLAEGAVNSGVDLIFAAEPLVPTLSYQVLSEMQIHRDKYGNLLAWSKWPDIEPRILRSDGSTVG